MAIRPHWKYGLLFLAGSAALFYLASRGGPWLLLIWPGVALAVVALAYLTGAVALLGKRRDGTRSPIATLVLAPFLVLLRAAWSMQLVIFHETPYNMVGERLIVARRMSVAEYPSDVAVICDLTAEMSDPRPIRTSIAYRCYPILDAHAVPPNELIALARSLAIPDGRRLLIHCANGHGRTGMVAAAWLVAHGGAISADDAIVMLRSARPRIRLNRRQRAALDGAIDIMHARAKPAASPEPATDAERSKKSTV